MNENLKIDIIYYDTPSDFAFEFNLGGCCRSRILTTRCDSPKDMINGLARAVSRSRVIILIGRLSEDDGLIPLVSKAISKPLVTIDHRQYHITTPESIRVTEGGLPLVTRDGSFGGCILESGPQSIIMISEKSHLREVIMDQLIGQYITSLSRIPDTENDLLDPSQTASAQDKEPTNASAEQSATDTETTDTTLKDAETDETNIEPMMVSTGAVNDEDFILPFDFPDDFDGVTQDDSVIRMTPSQEKTDDQPEEALADSVPQEPTAPIEMPENEPMSDKQPDVFESQDISSQGNTHSTHADALEDETSFNQAPRKKDPLLTLFIWLCAALLLVAALFAYLFIYQPSLSGQSPLEAIRELLIIVIPGRLL